MVPFSVSVRSAFHAYQNPLLLGTYAAMAVLVLSIAHTRHSLSQNPVFALAATSDTLDLPVFPSPPPPIPVVDSHLPPPYLTASAALVLDVDSGTILYEHQPDTPLLPASTTKIMTALVALDTYNLNDVLTITNEAATKGNTIGLIAGELITVHDLLYGTLVGSGNDAALALALSYPHGGYSGFVQAMNQKASQLQLQDTHFSNVSGVESPRHYTTARDLAFLTREALKNATFSSIVATKRIQITSVDGRFVHLLESTNELLGTFPGVIGVKTGWTEEAGECLVTSVSRDSHHLITVVLNSRDRFGDSRQLIDWAFQAYAWYPATENLTDLPN